MPFSISRSKAYLRYCWICFKGGSHAYNCWLPHLYNSMLVFFKK